LRRIFAEAIFRRAVDRNCQEGNRLKAELKPAVPEVPRRGLLSGSFKRSARCYAMLAMKIHSHPGCGNASLPRPSMRQCKLTATQDNDFVAAVKQR
jgi:hypothetical protein